MGLGDEAREVRGDHGLAGVDGAGFKAQDSQGEAAFSFGHVLREGQEAFAENLGKVLGVVS